MEQMGTAGVIEVRDEKVDLMKPFQVLFRYYYI